MGVLLNFPRCVAGVRSVYGVLVKNVLSLGSVCDVVRLRSRRSLARGKRVEWNFERSSFLQTGSRVADSGRGVCEVVRAIFSH